MDRQTNREIFDRIAEIAIASGRVSREEIDIICRRGSRKENYWGRHLLNLKILCDDRGISYESIELCYDYHVESDDQEFLINNKEIQEMSEEKTAAQSFDEAWMDILGEAEEEASRARERVQFGKFNVVPRYLRWVDDDGKRKPREISAADYRNVPERERSLEVVCSVDIQEFNPNLDWTYERKVGVGSADWHEILKPSVESLLGEGTMDPKTMGTTLGSLRGKYVRVADVLQAPTKRNPNPTYRTIRLDVVYDDRASCYAEWEATYGGSLSDADVDPLAEPAGFDQEWDGFNLEDEATSYKDLVAEYGGLDGLASDYYGVSVESLVNALVQGGLSAKDIASEDKNYNVAKVRAMVA